MNEIRTVSNIALDKLPLFASDLEIAVAIVGKQNASRWKRDMIPILEHKGFPRFDKVHQGRPVHLVKLFYAAYHSPEINTAQYRLDAVRTEESRREEEARWKEIQQRKADKKAQAKANADAWAEKKRNALEAYRAKKAAEAASVGS
ncbi:MULTISPECIES: hypothetical protein [unclassified Mesorhizobium]|uniref:hypothetical protein n=1 Tax=unclassified Mesorhizobium TaxID=325217 RepID=UPI001CD010A5|nr:MULTISPECIES: hypothetical protein [unclassified Mesorhizobium]MBZ9741027.1 hypothetical protein [Mesorhizobium sp. CO1-1-4]MBZ9804364.1 hypothetical protein [Mesorhizobium sp. ES1-6]